MTSIPDLEALEAMVAKFGLFEVLVAISVICNDKAAELSAAADRRSALKWRNACNVVENAAQHTSVDKVSP